MSRTIGLVFLACGLLVWPGISISDAEAAKRKRLTCSFIEKQCRIGCRKEAPGPFCLNYCSNQKAECLRTGEWLGIRRTFRNVRRR